MSTMANLKKYVDVGVETSVISADPHKLIQLLYQGALLSIAAAKNHMLRKEIASKGKSISQAISIIDSGLRASLNKEVGGELAKNLDALYEYMSRRLFYANLHNDTAVLDEISSLLVELRGAWESIKKPGVGTPPAVHEAPLQTSATQKLYGEHPATSRFYERV
jgi:flagellar protein FliS